MNPKEADSMISSQASIGKTDQEHLESAEQIIKVVILILCVKRQKLSTWNRSFDRDTGKLAFNEREIDPFGSEHFWRPHYVASVGKFTWNRFLWIETQKRMVYFDRGSESLWTVFSWNSFDFCKIFVIFSKKIKTSFDPIWKITGNHKRKLLWI